MRRFRFLLFIGAVSFLSGCDSDPNRVKAFQQKVEEGRPLVRAIEQFQKDTGDYPKSLAELAPRYLPEVATNISDRQHRFGGWEYYTYTNGAALTYKVAYFMGKGGVRYTPHYWTGSNDGHETIISQEP